MNSPASAEIGTAETAANRHVLLAQLTGGFDPTRPDVAFILVWTIVILIYVAVPTPVSPPFDSRVLAMIFANMATGVLTFSVARTWVARKHALLDEKAFKVTSDNARIVDNFVGALFVIWLFVYALNIIYSGGLGLIWVMQGADSGHTEWGIPTLGGLNYMIRCFLGAMLIIRFAQTRRTFYLIIWMFLAFCYVLEINRGGMFVFICHTVAIIFLMYRVSFKNLIVGATILVVLAVMYGALGSLRGIESKASNYGDTTEAVFSALPSGTFDIWAYLVTPIGNVNHAARLGNMRHNYVGYFTFAPVLPSFIRVIVMPDPHDYPVDLIVEGYNATSMYGPLLSDFGYVTAVIFVAVMQFGAGYVYAMARRGYWLHKLLYPPIFTAIALSMFYIYALSLVVLMYPILCFWLKHYVNRRQKLGGGAG